MIPFNIYQLIISFLLLLYILGAFSFGVEKVILQVLPAILGAVIFGSIFDYLEIKRWQFPQTPLISGMIIGLVAQFGEKAWVLFTVAALAMAVKFLVKLDGHHIFNPAGSGLLLGALLLGSYPSWWVGTGSFWPFLIWIPVFLYKFRRWAPMVGFLLPLVILNGVNILMSSSILFFISVMLIEPKTSPGSIKLGLIYGVIVASTYFVLTSTPILPDPLIGALLAGNLWSRLLEKVSIKWF